jgi:hypothetical protein
MRELTGGTVSLEENKIEKRFALEKEEKGFNPNRSLGRHSLCPYGFSV